MTTKELAKKTVFLNKDIKLISNSEIIEYDMRNAGFSLIKKYRMLPDSKIKELEKLGKKETVFDKKYGKHERDIEIGKLQRKDSNLSDKLKVAFTMERERFLEMNQISENEIISIKKDAFFISSAKCIHGEIDEFINFRKKNRYTSYLYIKPFEIYFKKGELLEIKGMGDEAYEKHKDYMIHFIYTILQKLETQELSSVLNYFRRFIDSYKGYELDTEYYRIFDNQSKFIYTDGDTSDLEYRQDKKELFILNNYTFLIKFLSIIME